MKLSKIAVLAYFAAFALCLAFIVPPWEPPDEPSHLFYVNFVAERAGLPNQYEPANSVVGEGHQPPLYYVLGAVLNRLLLPDRSVDLDAVRNPRHVWSKGSDWNVPVYRHTSAAIFATPSDRVGFYALRLLSVVLALANLACMWKIFALFVREAGWSTLAAFLVATLPQLAFVSASINNDNLANLLSTLTLYLGLRLLRAPERSRDYALAGLALGLGLLSKKTLLFAVPSILVVLAYLALTRASSPGAIARRGALLLGVAALVSSPFFVRNYLLYGELLGTHMERSTLTALVQPTALFSPYFWTSFPLKMFMSYVGEFGYMNVPMPLLAYAAYALLVIVGGAGLVLYLRRRRDARVWFGLLFILACLAGAVVYNLTYRMPQGRFMFPVVALLAALLALGWKTALETIRSARVRQAVLLALVLTLIMLDALSVAVVYRFYYAAAQYG